MKVGLDVDGVLADFVQGFNELVKAETSITLPYPAPSWDWAKEHGVSSAQLSKIWDLIKTGPFWGTLHALPGAIEALQRLNALSRQKNDIYFITTRPGGMAKFWTELWLRGHGMEAPTVLIAEHKGPVAKGFKLDVFIDDKPENNLDVINETGRNNDGSPSLSVYLLDQPWNQWADQPFNYGTRIGSLAEILDRELGTPLRKVA